MAIAQPTVVSGSPAIASRAVQPLDIIFFAITLVIPIETILQAAFGASMAFGRFIAPLFIVAYLALRPSRASFRLPTGFLLVIPYFLVSLGHIAAQGEWFGVYNYRTYVLNAILCVAVYNYTLSNRPSPNYVLMATYAGILLIALWTIASGQAGQVARGGRFTMLDLDENGLGSTYGLAIIVAVVMACRADVRLPVKAVLLAGSLPCAALLLATGSRGALASTLLGVLAQAIYLAVFRRRTGFLVGLVALAILVTVGKWMYDQTDVMKERVARMTAESGSQDRFGYRDRLFIASLGMVVERPIQGWGEKAGWDELGKRSFAGSFAGTHNTFMLVLVTSGVLAGGAMLWWMLRPMIPRKALLAVPNVASMYIIMVFLYATFLTLDRFSYRAWWWLFPVFLAQLGMARAGIKQQTPPCVRYSPALMQPQTS